MDGVFEIAILPIGTVLYVVTIFSVLPQLVKLIVQKKCIIFPSEQDLKLRGQPIGLQIMAASPIATAGLASIWSLLKINKEDMSWISEVFWFQVVVSVVSIYLLNKISVTKKQKWLVAIFAFMPFLMILGAYFSVEAKLKPVLLLFLSIIIGPALYFLAASLRVHKASLK